MPKPHIVIIAPRGEVIRNFFYSDTLDVLSRNARVTVLSIVADDALVAFLGNRVERVIHLEDVTRRESRLIHILRYTRMMAYWRSVWSITHQNRWAEHEHRASGSARTRIRHAIATSIYRMFANQRGLDVIRRIERALSFWLRPTNTFIDLFREIKPDLVFCGSHIHGESAYHPVQAANHLGIPTAAFVFSWDNLTSQGPIIPQYDHLMVWHSRMRDDLLRIYPQIPSSQVYVTGTPQFDFYFDSRFFWSKEDFCQRMGISPERPIVLYTTAFPTVFPEEDKHLDALIALLEEYPAAQRPQLLVRVYAKDTQGTFDRHKVQYADSLDVFFPPVKWNAQWYTPLYDDLYDFTNMVRHCDLGINGASTVSLELAMHGKPVINLGFDPPGSNLPHVQRWMRHLEFDHYHPIAKSGAVMVARSLDDLRTFVRRGLEQPTADQPAQQTLIAHFFEDKLDGQSGRRAAEILLKIVEGG